MRRTLLLLTTAALAAALASGCGDSDGGSTGTGGTGATAPPSRTVDTAAVEQGIAQQLSVSGAKVTKASCPNDVAVAPGDTFTCSVSWSSGATGKAKVTQESRHRYSYTTVPGSVQVPGTAVAAQVQRSLADQGFPNAAVTCPQTVVVKTGSPVTCDVSGAGAGGTVTFTFSDAEGNVSSSSVQAGSA